MKPNANLFLNKVVLDFTKSQNEFLEQVGFFNPESQINNARKHFSDVKDVSLTRLISWQAVNENGEIKTPLYDHRTFPYPHSLEALIQNLNGTNFKSYLKHPDLNLKDFINFKILEVKWFIFLDQVKNSFAPPYAPKRLDKGLKFVLSGNKLTVSFQQVSRSLWYEVDYNPTTVIPLTHENFDRIIRQQADLAKTYLKEKEEK